MQTVKIKVQAFLNAYKMTASGVKTETILNDFASEMRAGLEDDESSLAMIAIKD